MIGEEEIEATKRAFGPKSRRILPKAALWFPLAFAIIVAVFWWLTTRT
jgi:hypothetical protein